MERQKNLNVANIEGSYENPFIRQLKGKMYVQSKANVFIGTKEAIYNRETGEIEDKSLIMGRAKMVDKSQFLKVYISNLKEFLELSKTAVNVLLYMSKNLDKENKALFDVVKEYKELGYKQVKSVWDGIKELINKDMIYPYPGKKAWWINPLYICKYERLGIYKEYVLRKTEDIRSGMSTSNYQSRLLGSELEREKERHREANGHIQYKIDRMRDEGNTFTDKGERVSELYRKEWEEERI